MEIALLVPLATLLLLVLWIILPFAVFGIKPLLQKAVHELEKINSREERIEYMRIDKKGK